MSADSIPTAAGTTGYSPSSTPRRAQKISQHDRVRIVPGHISTHGADLLGMIRGANSVLSSSAAIRG
jgi:hypothetical protein